MFDSLSEEQKLVLSTPGDLLVIAGPGSGKTRTLVSKVVRLLEDGVSPEKIYLLTFSVKVCLELRKRLEELGLKGVKVDTFHGLAYDLIRANDGKPPTVISKKERDEVLNKLFPGVKDPLSKDELKRIYYDYLEKNGLYDFDFLVYKASTLEGFNFKDSYVIVDEFQDLAQDLFPLLERLTPATWVFFGDPNQSIYGFRGANPEKLKTFLEKAKPTLKICYLTQSFRCREAILNFAENFKASPWSSPRLRSTASGGEVLGFLSYDEFQEKEKLSKIIKENLGGLTLESAQINQVSPDDIFILSRLRVLLAPVKEWLLQEGFPVSLPEEEARVIYQELSQFLQSPRVQHLPVEQALSEVSPELKSYLLNLYELFERDKEKFLAYLSNLKEPDLVLPKRQGIKLMTIHASKGLEAKIVILIGAEDGLIPLTIFKDFDLDEERRTVFVALTRAKDKFYFFIQKGRRAYGRSFEQTSHFFLNFPIKILEKPKLKAKQKTLF